MKKLDLEKEEPLLTNTEPVGSNTLTSRATFFQRKLYELEAFDGIDLGDTDFIDFWYDKTFYGRINPQSKPVHVSEGFLRQISGTPDLFALNFVVDAFEDLREYVAFARARGLEPNSAYSNIQPFKAWDSLNNFYHEVMTALFEKFKSYVETRKKDHKIKDFKTFVNVFVQFVDSNTPLLPFTRSKLVISRLANPRSSGLVIELGDDSHADDKPKVERFLSDPNFAFFKEAAKRFGFAVDKHAPWRLVADIDSIAIQPYMEQYGLTKENLFKRYYYTSHEIDIEALKAYVIQFYNSYVSGKRFIVKPEFTYDKCGRLTVVKTEFVRETKTQEEIEKSTSDEFWLRMYAYIRGRESNKAWNQAEFEKIVRNAFLFAKGVDKSAAVEYIDRRTRVPSGSSRKERFFHFLNLQRLT